VFRAVFITVEYLDLMIKSMDLIIKLSLSACSRKVRAGGPIGGSD
jgi:hypothetical protein